MVRQPRRRHGPVELTIVTVCMNRRQHLLATAPRVAAWPHHQRHLIVDWSSAEPLRRGELPDDPRLRLLRVDGEGDWNLCRAYNFAIAQAGAGRLLKLDADAWPTAAFDPAAPELALSGPAGICAFGSGPGGRKGQFLMEAALFAAVGGFHELMVGYGFDDKDLQARLRGHTGHPPRSLAVDWLGVIAHGDEERAGQGRARGPGSLRFWQGQAAMRASLLANRLVAAHCPWGERSPRSRYSGGREGRWWLEPASRPLPPPAVAAELDQARRLSFWGAFLLIPERAIECLPYSLFPPRCAEGWPVRWWHRLWWHSGRRGIWWGVGALMGLRGLLVGLAGLTRPKRSPAQR